MPLQDSKPSSGIMTGHAVPFVILFPLTSILLKEKGVQ